MPVPLSVTSLLQVNVAIYETSQPKAPLIAKGYRAIVGSSALLAALAYSSLPGCRLQVQAPDDWQVQFQVMLLKNIEIIAHK